jgi:maltose/moltooligosaccharide transporter
MGIFNFFIVIPQIAAAGMLGYIMHTFLHNEAINALLLGGGSMILSGILALFVQDNDA